MTNHFYHIDKRVTYNFQGFMDKNTQHLLLTELHSATGYLERLNFALDELYNQTQLPQIGELKEGGCKSLLLFIEREIMQKSFQTHTSTQCDLGMAEVLEHSKNIMVSLLKFQFEPNSSLEATVNYINLVYSLCFPIHKMIEHYGNLEVQFPRTVLVEVEAPNEDEEIKINRFQLNKNAILSLQGTSSTISSLQWQRSKKAKELIRKGHEAIFKQDHDLALESFKKALNYIESAEILTLIGWTHSLKGENEQAKSYCLKAIQKDPDYGPPYNDMGTYLMDENHINESLKWFELAKKCTNYQNKEYPYINAGRAYMAKHDYTRALEEFSQALAYAPHHEELHATVQKIKENINKRRSFTRGSGEETPPPS